MTRRKARSDWLRISPWHARQDARASASSSDATRSLPGASRSSSACRQGFLTLGSSAFAVRPSPFYRTSDPGVAGKHIADHSGGNRAGFSPDFPCSPLKGQPATTHRVRECTTARDA
jgi:hypothetical protein